ncbi:MAG: hypothetical protein KatS3mg105_5272 [Gemmatales bacterium]|nr:MAG: hypothetical protein KatS3mg105_5272 [Gemmatales bacterium]
MTIDQLLNEAAGQAGLVRRLRLLEQPVRRQLSKQMAAILSQEHRTSVPLATALLDALSNKLFVRSVITDSDPLPLPTSWPVAERRAYRFALRDGYAVLAGWLQDTDVTIAAIPAYDGTTGAIVAADGIAVVTDNGETIDIYYQDRQERYRAAGAGWRLEQTTKYPVVNDRPLGPLLIAIGTGQSELLPVESLLEALEAAVLDLQAVSRSQGWPQRYLVTDGVGQFLRSPFGQPLLGPDGLPIRRELLFEPGSILKIDAGEKTEFGQLAPATTDTAAIRQLLELISLVSGVPLHYFTGDWPSGIALLTVEQRINAKAEYYQALFTAPLVKLFQRIADLQSYYLREPARTVRDLDWYSPQIETEEIKQLRAKAVVEQYQAGLLDRRTALRLIYPDWPEERLDEITNQGAMNE